MLRASPPRQLHVLGERRPVCVFGDAAAEGENFSDVTFGGVLIDPIDNIREMYGNRVSKCN